MKLLYILLVGIFLELCSGAGTRMCMPDHPQKMFCKADYAIRAKVISKVKEEIWEFSASPEPTILPTTSTSIAPSTTSSVAPKKDIIEVQKNAAGLKEKRSAHVVKYQEVQVQRILKGKNLIKKYSKSGKKAKKTVVRIYLNQAQLNDTNLLIVGKVIENKLWVSFCDWCTSWKSLTIDQKKGLKKYYRLNCECEVMVSFDSKSRYKSSKRGCYWVPNFSYSAHVSDDCGYQHQYCHRNKRGYCEMTMKSYISCVNKKQP